MSTLELLAPTDADVLSPEALELVAKLHRELNPTRLELLERRRERQAELDAGALPEFVAPFASPTGGWRRLRPISGTGASRSRAPSTAR